MKAKIINVDARGQEITQNISGFPVSCYFSQFTSKTYDYVDWHWHLEFQFCIVIKGHVRWRIGANHIIVSAGNGIFINSQQIHMAEPYLCDNAEFFCVDFRPDLICPDKTGNLYSSFIAPVLNNPAIQAVKLFSGEKIDRILLEDLNTMSMIFLEQEDGFEFELVSKLFPIWKQLFKKIEHCTTRKDKLPDMRLKEILMYLQKNYFLNVSLEEIASSIGLSKSECCRYFKKQTGQTIFEYLIQYRLRKSLDLLYNTDMEIAQVALESGFSSQSYYTSRFKALMGCTPRQYRSSMKQRR